MGFVNYSGVENILSVKNKVTLNCRFNKHFFVRGNKSILFSGQSHGAINDGNRKLYLKVIEKYEKSGNSVGTHAKKLLNKESGNTPRPILSSTMISEYGTRRSNLSLKTKLCLLPNRSEFQNPISNLFLA